jgi:single-stranded DNA-binding protein
MGKVIHKIDYLKNYVVFDITAGSGEALECRIYDKKVLEYFATRYNLGDWVTLDGFFRSSKWFREGTPPVLSFYMEVEKIGIRNTLMVSGYLASEVEETEKRGKKWWEFDFVSGATREDDGQARGAPLFIKCMTDHEQFGGFMTKNLSQGDYVYVVGRVAYKNRARPMIFVRHMEVNFAAKFMQREIPVAPGKESIF